MPYLLTFAFLGLVAAMGYELSRAACRPGELAHQLQDSEARMSLAAEAAELDLWEWDMATEEIWVTDTRRADLGVAFEPDSITSRSLLARIHPEDRETVLRASPARGTATAFTRRNTAFSGRTERCAGWPTRDGWSSIPGTNRSRCGACRWISPGASAPSRMPSSARRNWRVCRG